jgi:hypothetical protein
MVNELHSFYSNSAIRVSLFRAEHSEIAGVAAKLVPSGGTTRWLSWEPGSKVMLYEWAGFLRHVELEVETRSDRRATALGLLTRLKDAEVLLTCAAIQPMLDSLQVGTLPDWACAPVCICALAGS